MPKLDLRSVVAAKSAIGIVRGMKGVGWSWDYDYPVDDGNLIDLSVPPAQPEGVNYWEVESFNPLVLKPKDGATSGLTGWPVLFEASTRYRISWDYTPIDFIWNGGDRIRGRTDDTGSSTSPTIRVSSANPLVGSYEYWNSPERMMWIGPAAVISGTQRLQVNRLFVEAM